ncbi:hypothetical protein EVJ58_g10576, partial [Rhodofomes roseus]
MLSTALDLPSPHGPLSNEDNAVIDTSTAIVQPSSMEDHDPLNLTTYKDLSPSTASAGRSPGLSYAAMASRTPSPLGAQSIIRYSPRAENTQAAPLPIVASNHSAAVGMQDDQPADQSSDGAGWSIATNKKRNGKARAGPPLSFRRTPSSLHATPSSLHATTSSLQIGSPPSTGADTNVEPRKRRRLEDDLGEDWVPESANRKQNALQLSSIDLDGLYSNPSMSPNDHKLEQQLRIVPDVDFPMA